MSVSGFKHSNARVPRLYKEAGKIVRQIKEEGGSFKGLVFSSKHRSLKSLYALVAETLRHGPMLDTLLLRTQILFKEPRLDPWLVRVLITEMLWRQRSLAGLSIPLKIVQSYRDEFQTQLAGATQQISTPELSAYPRFVRVNTLKTSMENILQSLKTSGWTEVTLDCSKIKPKSIYKKFKTKAMQLAQYEFMRDIHIPDLLLFHHDMQFYELEEYHNGFLLLQDKASCLSAFILTPPPGSTVLDMCAAPGMKTTHIAAAIANQGQVYAIEKNSARFQSLCKIVEKAGANCVKPILGDSMQYTFHQLKDVEYIVVDPTCSGSGMKIRKELFNDSDDVSKHRLNKLSAFQCSILRHAMTQFPQAKRIVYSTCSLNPEENEAVVESVLKTVPPNFRPVMPSEELFWMKKGSNDYLYGEYGVYTLPEKDLTNGFFVVLFERTESEHTFGRELAEKNEFPSTNADKNNYSPKEVRSDQLKRKRPKIVKTADDTSATKMAMAMKSLNEGYEEHTQTNEDEDRHTRKKKKSKHRKSGD